MTVAVTEFVRDQCMLRASALTFYTLLSIVPVLATVKVLGKIEAALNAMWDVRQPRSWGRRFSDYLAVMLIAPILFLVAGHILDAVHRLSQAAAASPANRLLKDL
jgi:uncharacterized BrkB/YihY/UPF0761 family membrane protein